MIISKYPAYKSIWMLFIIKLNSLSAASAIRNGFKYRPGLLSKAGIYLIIKTGIYSEEAFIRGNTVILVCEQI